MGSTHKNKTLPNLVGTTTLLSPGRTYLLESEAQDMETLLPCSPTPGHPLHENDLCCKLDPPATTQNPASRVLGNKPEARLMQFKCEF